MSEQKKSSKDHKDHNESSRHHNLGRLINKNEAIEKLLTQTSKDEVLLSILETTKYLALSVAYAYENKDKIVGIEPPVDSDKRLHQMFDLYEAVWNY
ncbi:hypothetical protein [Flammeovirga aprica]|uniref:Uncharacterized protein n=1 Tax=Flammeovirga aprica JL-4 TaxID=694437 RepID=A0A7X9RQW4_9BACT|nr:hypothetical protein [Flammeovirga aprica]NME67188.1 hypothetical protein [Flammeovirga aprica JL-4]